MLWIRYFWANELAMLLTIAPLVVGFLKTISVAKKANANSGKSEAEEKSYRSSMKVLSGIIAFIGLLVTIALSVNYYEMRMFTKIPNVLNISYGNAEAKLNEAELHVRIAINEDIVDDSQDYKEFYYHKVQGLDPASGTILPKWETVTVYIESTPDPDAALGDNDNLEPEIPVRDESSTPANEESLAPDLEDDYEGPEDNNPSTVDNEKSSSSQQQPHTTQLPVAESWIIPYESTIWHGYSSYGYMIKYDTWPVPFPKEKITIDGWVQHYRSGTLGGDAYIRLTGLHVLPLGEKSNIPISLEPELYSVVKNTTYPVLLATYEYSQGLLDNRDLLHGTSYVASSEGKYIGRDFVKNTLEPTPDYWYCDNGLLIHVFKDNYPPTSDMVYGLSIHDRFLPEKTFWFEIHFPLVIEPSGNVKLLKDFLME